MNITLTKLNKDFYDRDTIMVAKELLGKYIVHKVNGIDIVARIVETEAYKGTKDKACHTFGNRMTKRNKIMFGSPGYAYVYLIYGMYSCMNVVTEKEGNPCAVLIRAVEPINEFDVISHKRFNKDYASLNKRSKINLSNGPGKLCIVLGITRDNYGDCLWGNDFYIAKGNNMNDFEIVSAKRINIDYAEEAKDYPWRFYIKGNPYISKK